MNTTNLVHRQGLRHISLFSYSCELENKEYKKRELENMGGGFLDAMLFFCIMHLSIVTIVDAEFRHTTYENDGLIFVFELEPELKKLEVEMDGYLKKPNIK